VNTIQYHSLSAVDDWSSSTSIQTVRTATAGAFVPMKSAKTLFVCNRLGVVSSEQVHHADVLDQGTEDTDEDRHSDRR